jgi:hypothetical protein
MSLYIHCVSTLILSQKWTDIYVAVVWTVDSSMAPSTSSASIHSVRPRVCLTQRSLYMAMYVKYGIESIVCFSVFTHTSQQVFFNLLWVYLTLGSIRTEEGCCDSPQRHKRTNADYSYGFKQIPSTSARPLYICDVSKWWRKISLQTCIMKETTLKQKFFSLAFSFTFPILLLTP